MSAAVVTPWFGNPELQADYFYAIALGPPPDELIIIDNGSDPPLEFAHIRNEENVGFCHACNQGLAAAHSEIVVFLNNDIQAIREGWLDNLCAAVEPGVLAGAQLRSDTHTIVDGVVYPYLDGWCLAGRRDDLRSLGGFDTTLEEPAYYSDNLLCLEARARGFTLREARIGLEHMVGATSGGATNPDAAAATRANHQRYQRRTRALVKGATPA